MAPFAIVPVLDLKGGQVVHARAGERSRYMPIKSTLAAGSEPRAVLDGLLSLARFRRVYIADLDAIEGRGDHGPLIAALAREFRDIGFWLDGGFAGAAAAAAARAHGAAPVLGSESLPDAAALSDAVTRLGKADCVLSLDYRGDALRRPGGDRDVTGAVAGSGHRDDIEPRRQRRRPGYDAPRRCAAQRRRAPRLRRRRRA